MMTIKKISEVSGVSARTLRYYDEIGLFSPTEKSDAGYRLYDEASLEILQQILYFREMSIPLNTIKEIIRNPDLDTTNILKMQKKMLEAERTRIDRLIDSIDSVLKGAEVNFSVFTREESEDLFEAMLEHMPEEMQSVATKEFGSVEQWREHYLDTVGSDQMQKQYAKVVDWYGGKYAYAEAVKNPLSKDIQAGYQKRIEHILEKLAAKREADVNSPEIRELIGEYGCILKRLLQMKDEKGMMLSQAHIYLDKQVQAITDDKYGKGFSEFLSNAITVFYEE